MPFYSPMKKRKLCCPTALKGGTCTDSSCSKSHQYILCELCDRVMSTNSLKDHTNGKKHLQKVLSYGPPILLQDLPSRSVSSNLRSTPHINSLPISLGSTPTTNASPPVTGSGEGGSLAKVAYCAATLQGEVCIDNRCQYRHDIVRCEPCGRSFPASLLHQHQSGRHHLEIVTSKSFPNPCSFQHPYLSQPSPPNSRIPEITSQESWDNLKPLIPDHPYEDPQEPVTVSHKGGLDFVIEGNEAEANTVFPPLSHIIMVENTSSLSNLSMQSMKLRRLVPSQSPWYE